MPWKKSSDDAITNMFKQTAIIKPYIGEEQKIKDGLVAIDNMNENDPYAWVWNLPGWN